METTQPKTITTRAGETFTLDFYCAARSAHMTFIGCDRMREAAQKKKPHHLAAWSCDTGEESPCIGCEQGAAIAARNHARREPGRNRNDAPKPTCLWPGCNEKTWASGLCQRHSRQLKRNALVTVNTAAAGATACRDFLEKLVQMANDADMPVEDVALAAMDEGVKVYFERKRRSTPAQP